MPVPQQPRKPGANTPPAQQPQKVKSNLAAKYGEKLDAAIKQHADDETTYGRIELPPGVRGGIMRVQKCYFKQFEKNTNQKKGDGSSAEGEYFFYIEGVADSPDSQVFDGVARPVRGLVDSKVEAICDTKNNDGKVTTQEEHIDNVLNIMRQVAGPDFTHGATLDTLEELAAQLEQAAPYFWFSTTARAARADGQGVKKGDVVGVWVNWEGNRGLENYSPEEQSNFNDQSGGQQVASPPPAPAPAPAPGQVGSATPPAPAPARTPPKKPPTVAAPAPAPEPDPEPQGDVPYSEWSLEDLVSLADSDADTAEMAQQELQDRAIAAGYSEEQINSEEVTWPMIKEWLEAEPQEDEEQGIGDTPAPPPPPPPPAAPGAVTPKTGMVYKYAPPNPKKKGHKLAPRDCKCEKVDKAKKTADLADLGNNIKYSSVQWAELS